MGVDFGFDDYSPPSKEQIASSAASNGIVSTIAKQLEEGLDINFWSGKLLRNAASQGHRDVIDFLLEKGADIEVALKSARSSDEDKAVAVLENHIERRAQEELMEKFNGFAREGDTIAIRKQFLDNGAMIVTRMLDFETREITTVVEKNGSQSMFVRNFGDLEDQNVIEQAYQAIKAQGANPPDWNKSRVVKTKPVSPLNLNS